MIPDRLTRPTVGLMPTSPTRTKDRRSTRRSRCRRRSPRGSRQSRRPCPSSIRRDCDRARTDSSSCPPRALHPLVDLVDRKFAHSLRLVFPRITAPAARRRSTTNASRAAIDPSSASDPAVVIIRSAVSMLSLIRMGMPCSGPRGPLALRSASSASAIAPASGLTLDDRAQRRPRAIDRSDPRQIQIDQPPRCVAAALHPLLKLLDGDLVELERRRRRLRVRIRG